MSSPLFPDTFHAHPPATKTSNRITVSTDGSCLKNPGGASGWAWYSSDGCWAAGAFPVGTNQQAELLAVLHALQDVPLDLPLLIIADSKYALNSCTTWIRSWKAKGWRKADGKPVMNLELMQALDAAMAARRAQISFRWVKGHTGDVMNENADFRCGEAAHAIQKHAAVNEGPGWGTGPTDTQTAPPSTAKPGHAPRPRTRRR